MKDRLKMIRMFFTSKMVWAFLFCLALCVLIWWVGPAIAVYSRTPFQSVEVRILLIVGVLIVFMLVRCGAAIKAYLAVFFNLQARPEFHFANAAYRQQKRQTQRDFKKLKKQRSYELPWYLVMGEAGSGKTSFLREAELNLLYQSYHHISHHTKTFQWVLAEEALFID